MVSFFNLVPVYSVVPSDQVVFQDPADFSWTEIPESAALPDSYGEVILNGTQLIPQLLPHSGNVYLNGISLTASGLLEIIASNNIFGLTGGSVLSADDLYLSAGADMFIGSTLIGDSSLFINTFGSIYMQDDAVFEADQLSLSSLFGSISGSSDSLLSGSYLTVGSYGSVMVNTDIGGLTVNTIGFGDISVNNTNSFGIPLLLNDGVIAANGSVNISSNTTIIAANVQGNSINLITTGIGSIELGYLDAFNEGTINLNSARNIVDRGGVPSVVYAGNVNLIAGLNMGVISEWINSGMASVADNLSVLIDENYTGPLQIDVPGDIIIDKAVVALGDVSFNASNIIFTDKGSLSNISGSMTALNAMNTVSFGGYPLNTFSAPSFRTFGSTSASVQSLAVLNAVSQPVIIQAGDITINALNILGSEDVMISGSSLNLITDSGLVLNTQVDKLSAQVSGRGDLQVNSLSSIELTNVDVFDGSLTVNSGGNIAAQDVVIQTNRYSSQMNFNAAGTLSVGQIQGGQTASFNFVATAGISNVAQGLVIEVSHLNDVVYEGDGTSFEVVIRDPSWAYITHADTVDVTIAFGDGTPGATIPVPLPDLMPVQNVDSVQTLNGSQGNSLFGSTIAAGDVNGDGYPDAIMGESLYDTVDLDDMGRVVVYYGTGSGFETAPRTIIYGNQSSSGFGRMVESGLDVNNDGYDDVVVSSPNYDNWILRTIVNTDGTISEQQVLVKGQVQLYLGSANGLSSTPSWTLDGIEDVTLFGIPVASAGDVNNDGFDDLLVSSPYEDVVVVLNNVPVVLPQSGVVRLYLGGINGLSDEAAWKYSGKLSNGFFGLAISGAGDMDRDGYDDVIIGIPDTTGNGSVYLFSGRATGLTGEPEKIFDGDQAGSLFGATVAAAGDVNMDGFDDIVVGAPGYMGSDSLQRGAGIVIFGSNSTLPAVQLPVTIEAPAGVTQFGWEVAGVGDVNNDGYSDLLVRSASQIGKGVVGRVFLFLGASDGLSSLVILLDSAEIFDPATGSFNVQTGSLAGAGDFNSDGYDDFLVGSWTHGLNQEGAVFVYKGSEFAFPVPIIATVRFDHLYGTYGNYTVTASVPGDGNSAYVGSTIARIKSYPVAADDTCRLYENSVLTVNAVSGVINNDNDPDGDGDLLSAVQLTDVTNGVLAFYEDGSFEYTPNTGFAGTDSFTYMITDGIVNSNIATVRFNVIRPGDLNGDGLIDTYDLSVVRNAVGTREGRRGFNVEADFDGDGVVSTLDYDTWYGYYSSQIDAAGTGVDLHR